MTGDITEKTGTEELVRISNRIRREAVQMSHEASAPHLASSLSVADILTAVYWRVLRADPLSPDAPGRDRLIFSKGHAAASLYAALSLKGFFPTEMLKTYGKPGSSLGEHPLAGRVPGLEAATGSLGHGLPIGVGLSLAAKIKGGASRTIVVMSDGECNEGSVWEAAMFAPKHHLENLMVVIDFNRWQATGRSEEVLSLSPLADKWKAFGWSASEVDGHDLAQLCERMTDFPDGTGKPIALIALTVKGKGVSFMEDDNNWHYRVPTDVEVKKAFEELTPV